MKQISRLTFRQYGDFKENHDTHIIELNSSTSNDDGVKSCLFKGELSDKEFKKLYYLLSSFKSEE